MPEHSIHRITSLPIPAAVTPTMYSPPGMTADAAMQPVVSSAVDHADRTLAENDVEHSDEHEDEIDLDQLTALLTERLGHLSLPPRPE